MPLEFLTNMDHCASFQYTSDLSPGKIISVKVIKLSFVLFSNQHFVNIIRYVIIQSNSLPMLYIYLILLHKIFLFPLWSILYFAGLKNNRFFSHFFRMLWNCRSAMVSSNSWADFNFTTSICSLTSSEVFFSFPTVFLIEAHC